MLFAVQVVRVGEVDVVSRRERQRVVGVHGRRLRVEVVAGRDNVC